MRRPHLLRVDRGAVAYRPLLGAVRDAGLRVGWLEFRVPASPPPLEEAAAEGVLRAVAAGGGRVVVVKPVRGELVLEDLLREHFLGCSLVLVRGAVEAPRLEPEGEGWLLKGRTGPARRLDTAQLVAALGQSRPW